MKFTLSNISRIGVLILIVALSTLMHFKHFSKDLMSIHVWRQTQTQSNIVNFYEEDMNIFNPRRNDRGSGDGIYRMEFPVMQWIIACFYKIFGNSIIITRVFMFIVGLLTTLGLYKLLINLFNNEILAVLGAWTITFSPGFFYYTINPLPDFFALCCAIWGLVFFFRWYNKKNVFSLVLSGFFLALSALSKLPFIIYFIIPLIYFFEVLRKGGIKKKELINLTIALVLIIFPLAWYIVVVPQWGGNVIVKGIFDSEETFVQILDYMQHHLISALPEMHLNYASVPFFIAGFYFLFKNKAYKNEKFLLMLTLSIVVLLYFVFEINAITKVHDYYLFPFYPLLFILVAYGAYHLLQQKKGIRYVAVVCLLVLPFTCFIRMKTRWNPELPGFNKDLLVYKNELRDAVPKEALVVAGNDISHYIFFYYIDKKGWGFNNDELTAEKLKTMIEEGAKYLYVDSENIRSNSNIMGLVSEKIMEKGSISVYRLKR